MKREVLLGIVVIGTVLLSGCIQYSNGAYPIARWSDSYIRGNSSLFDAVFEQAFNFTDIIQKNGAIYDLSWDTVNLTITNYCDLPLDITFGADQTFCAHSNEDFHKSKILLHDLIHPDPKCNCKHDIIRLYEHYRTGDGLFGRHWSYPTIEIPGNSTVVFQLEYQLLPAEPLSFLDNHIYDDFSISIADGKIVETIPFAVRT